MTPQAFIFIGRSGAGKGTQAKMLMDLLKKDDPAHGIIYIQTGELLREFIKGPSYTEKITKDIYDVGGLQPEFIAIYLWVRAIVEQYTGNEHFVFDGAARRLEEAKVLGSIVDFYKLPKLSVIHIDVANASSMKRLLARKRFDDNEAEISKRLSWYDTDVSPVVEYFRTDPKFRFLEIDGERSVEDIHADIVKKVGLK
jgi:adenylate kinase